MAAKGGPESRRRFHVRREKKEVEFPFGYEPSGNSRKRGGRYKTAEHAQPGERRAGTAGIPLLVRAERVRRPGNQRRLNVRMAGEGFAPSVPVVGEKEEKKKRSRISFGARCLGVPAGKKKKKKKMVRQVSAERQPNREIVDHLSDVMVFGKGDGMRRFLLGEEWKGPKWKK